MIEWNTNAPPPRDPDGWMLTLRGWIAAAVLVGAILAAGRMIDWM